MNQLVFVNLDMPPDVLAESLQLEGTSCRLHVLDGYSDPEGWLANNDVSVDSRGTDLLSLKAFETVSQSILSKLTDQSVVVIDGVTTLIYRHKATSVSSAFSSLFLLRFV